MTYNYLSQKITIFLILFAFGLSNLIAQSPALINYQAVVRDANGNLITSGNISLGISIHDAIVGGNQLYFETHNGITPNSFGIVNVLIGGGTVLSGNFLMINWGNGTKFMQIYINNNPIGSRTQLVSYFYALYANRAGKADSALYVRDIYTVNATTGQVLKFNGIDFVPTNDFVAGNGIDITNNVIKQNIPNASVRCTTQMVLQYSTGTWIDHSCISVIVPQSGKYLINAGAFGAKNGAGYVNFRIIDQTAIPNVVTCEGVASGVSGPSGVAPQAMGAVSNIVSLTQGHVLLMQAVCYASNGTCANGWWAGAMGGDAQAYLNIVRLSD